LACHYYREPKEGELISSCNDGLTEIPSKTHENCMCRSERGIYADFCPIYAKLRKKELNIHEGGILKILDRFVDILIYAKQLVFFHKPSQKGVR